MQVGFIGFGEVASTLSQGLMENGVDVYTCIIGRGKRTNELAKKTKVKLYNSYKELAESSDILISSVMPSNAVNVAGMVGKYSNGIYVDMNNISPNTVRKTLAMIENGKTVDAAIIGSVLKNGINVKVIASGAFADTFAKLGNYGMNITVVGPENGQASEIKLLRSNYTKGVSALLFETIYHAYKLGIDKEVLNYISETEGQDFIDSAVSRIISTAFHAERRSEEMVEVIEMLSQKHNPIMSKATLKFFNNLNKNVKVNKRPVSYSEIFKLLSED